MDSSILLNIFYEPFYQRSLEPIILLLSEWRKRKFNELICIPDFIELEAMNAERLCHRDSKVRRFLKQVKTSELGFFLELRTPIRQVKAENRSLYLDLLPKKLRSIIIKNYKELSGTDIAILVTALFLANHTIPTSIASLDKTLLQAASEFSLTPYGADELCRKSTEAQNRILTTNF